MKQCQLSEHNSNDRRQLLTVIFVFTHILCLVVLLSYVNTCRYVGQNRCPVFSLPQIVSSNVTKNTKRCFVLSRNRNSVHELTESIVKYAGNNETRIRSDTNGTFTKRTRLCDRFVVLDKVQGRVGNQMFEIASLIGLAYKYDVIPIVPKDLPIHQYFNLPNRLIRNDKPGLVNVTKCDCKKAAFYYNCSEEFRSGTNVSILGYLQSWKYFAHARRIKRDVFTLKDVHVLKATKFIESISKENYQLVCIHVRRGDMTEAEKIRQGYVTANLSFIEKARAFYVKKYTNVQFIAVSDDKLWCEKNLDSITISPFTNPADDLALMTSCDHVIVTSGTFGWWGAWLSGGTTVYFNGYARPGSMLASEINMYDYYPPDWVGIS